MFQMLPLDSVPIRYRSCQILNRIIDRLVDRFGDVSYELFEELQEAMLKRTSVLNVYNM